MKEKQPHYRLRTLGKGQKAKDLQSADLPVWLQPIVSQKNRRITRLEWLENGVFHQLDEV